MKSGKPNVEHLQMIQSVISRLAGNSFLLKGWAVTLAAALSAISRADAHAVYAWVAAGVLVTFCALDSAYLAQERVYRNLFRAAVNGEVEPFTMAASKVTCALWFTAFRSWSVWPLYLTLGAGSVVVALSSP